MADAILNEVMADTLRCSAESCPTLTPDMILRHFIPGLDALLNYIPGAANRQVLPDTCSAFASRFFDQSVIETLLFRDGWASWSPYPISDPYCPYVLVDVLVVHMHCAYS